MATYRDEPAATEEGVACYCCGESSNSSDLVRFGRHPREGVCVGCAAWLHKRSLPIIHKVHPRGASGRAIPLLRVGGGSLREIARALGLNRQRVGQIVETTGGSRSWPRSRAGSGELLSCSFCGKRQQQVKKLIAGPGAFICDGCLERARTVLAVTDKSASTPITTIQQVSDENGEAQCSFCGKRRQQVAAMASASEARICNECLDLGNEIVRGNSG